MSSINRRRLTAALIYVSFYCVPFTQAAWSFSVRPSNVIIEVDDSLHTFFVEAVNDGNARLPLQATIEAHPLIRNPNVYTGAPTVSVFPELSYVPAQKSAQFRIEPSVSGPLNTSALYILKLSQVPLDDKESGGSTVKVLYVYELPILVTKPDFKANIKVTAFRLGRTPGTVEVDILNTGREHAMASNFLWSLEYSDGSVNAISSDSDKTLASVLFEPLQSTRFVLSGPTKPSGSQVIKVGLSLR